MKVKLQGYGADCRSSSKNGEKSVAVFREKGLFLLEPFLPLSFFLSVLHFVFNAWKTTFSTHFYNSQSLTSPPTTIITYTQRKDIIN